MQATRRKQKGHYGVPTPRRAVHTYILRDAALLCQVESIVSRYCGNHVVAITVQSAPYWVEIGGSGILKGKHHLEDQNEMVGYY